MRIRLAFKRRQLIALFTVVILSLHSLVPVGYMPDFSGHKMLVMCDGHHHHTGSENGDHGQDNNDVCPFSVGAIFNFEGFKAPVIVPPVYRVVATVAISVQLPVIRDTVFSNTSPRSPPFFS